jgi:ppGpp synthetase/RelA/SpoT-type nucleotidyltranferase
MSALNEIARLVREELLTLIQPVQLLSVNPSKATGKVSGRFRSNSLLFDYSIGNGQVSYRPVGSGSRKDHDFADVESLIGALQASRRYLRQGRADARVDGYLEVATALARMDASKGRKSRTKKAKCTTGYSCGKTCISRSQACRVQGRPGLDMKIVKLMEMTGDPSDPKTAMLWTGKGRGKKPTRITAENIGDFAGQADVSPIKGREAEGLAKAFVQGSPNTAIVPLASLVVQKDELQDPKFLRGAKADPRETAARAMGWEIDGDPRSRKKRDPLSVSDNGDGTFTVVDGNATAQAAMLAGWKNIPVQVVAYKGEPLNLRDDVAPSQRHTPMARKLAAGVRERAQQQEPAVTRMVVDLATKYNASMAGVEWRMKPSDSIASKIDRDTREYMSKFNMSESQAQRAAADNMGDAMRYTMVIDTGYTSKLKSLVSDLEASGHTIRVKNSWEEGQAFRGINMAVTGPNGEKFEIQLHTKASKAAAQKMHDLYNVYRESKDDTIRRRIYDRMLKIGEQAGSPYQKVGSDGSRSTNLRERRRLLEIGQRVFRGYQTTAEAFPGEQSRSQRRSTRANPAGSATTSRRRKRPA